MILMEPSSGVFGGTIYLPGSEARYWRLHFSKSAPRIDRGMGDFAREVSAEEVKNGDKLQVVVGKKVCCWSCFQ